MQDNPRSAFVTHHSAEALAGMEAVTRFGGPNGIETYVKC